MLTKVEIRTEDLKSVPQAAKILKRPKITLYRWIEKGKVQAIQLGDVLYIPTREVQRLQNGGAPMGEGAPSDQTGESGTHARLL
jgi:excisionase family DNA binding protein